MSDSTRIGKIDHKHARELLRHPEVRNYQVAALAALVFICGMLMLRGADLGGALTAVLGIAGVFLRWIAAPAFVLILTTYFILFPNGLPQFGYSDPVAMQRSFLRLDDLILCAAMLVYILSQYRLFGVLVQSVPGEGAERKAGEVIRRPPSAIPTSEIVPMFLTVAIVVLVGQVAWWLVSSVRVETGQGFTLTLPGSEYVRRPTQPGRFSAAGSRFVILAGMVFFLAASAFVLFAYRRYRTMSVLEATQILVETEWRENHRELSRIETWRKWSKRQRSHPGETRA